MHFDKDKFIDAAMAKSIMSWDVIKSKYPDKFVILYDFTLS